MKKFILSLGLVFLLIVTFLNFFFDPILKSLIEKNLSRDTVRKVELESLETNFFNKTLTVRNLKIKNNKIFPRENLIILPSLEVNFDLKKIFSKNIYFKKISIQNILVNYDLIIKDGRLIDSFYLIEENIKKDNKNKINSNDVKKNNESNLNKGPQIDFVIDKLMISKINISVYAKDLEFKKDIVLDQMTFDNVGNIKKSNHYKDVMAMIVTNMAININNDDIVKNLRKNFEKKIKDLLKKDNIKSLLGNDSDKIINKLQKFFK